MTTSPHNFEIWRARAKYLLSQEVPPSLAVWDDVRQTTLFSNESPYKPTVTEKFSIPASFLKKAAVVSTFRDVRALDLLYRILWRIVYEDRRFLLNPIDPDMLELSRIERNVRRDIHKMHAFVRFRKINDEQGELFVAWHCPDHLIVRLATPFFKRRFGEMRWTIFTPDESAHWDTHELVFMDGLSHPPKIDDDWEVAWKTYYGSTFNPARIKLRMMKSEMPVRHWKTLPETEIIDQLLKEAPARLEKMREFAPPAATPRKDASLDELKKDAACCTACPLYSRATQTVFGMGPETARIVVVGEQPGSDEDLAGKPFIGPAGEMLDRAFDVAGVDRSQVYITNAVKHFKWEERGKRRLHKRPNGDEILACRPWLYAELQRIKPAAIVCLGATAAQAVLGYKVTIQDVRGKLLSSPLAPSVMVTFHPAAILRVPDEQSKEKMFSMLAADLQATQSQSGKSRNELS